MEWIFRSPRTYYCLPPETAGELLESEVATMKYIKLNCSIPVPDVFDYRLVNLGAQLITILIVIKALLGLIPLGSLSFL